MAASGGVKWAALKTRSASPSSAAPVPMFQLWIKLQDILFAMLCCGRKKETPEHGTAGLPTGAKEPKTPASTEERRPASESIAARPRPRRLPPGHYSRSYPESEAVAFGQQGFSPTYPGAVLPPATGGPEEEEGRGEDEDTTRGGDRSLRRRRRDDGDLIGGRGAPGGQGQGANGGGVIDMGIKSIETYVDYTIIEKVEIVKRPGQTLGFYIREGNGIDRASGVFISRIAAGSAVEKNGLLRVGEEILAIDSIDVTNMSLDDVVILMSIPSRLMLTIRTRKSCCKNLSCPSLPMGDGEEDGEADDEGAAARIFRTPGDAKPVSVDEIMHPFSGAEFLFKPGTSLRRLQQQRGREPAEPKEDAKELRYSMLRPRYRPEEAPFVRERRYSLRQRPPAEPAVKQRPLSGRASFETIGSWDRRLTSAAAAATPYSSSSARRQVRYHPDYSSDTDAQFVQMEPPPREWIRAEVHPVPKKEADATEYVEMKELARSRSKRKVRKPEVQQQQPQDQLPGRDDSTKRYSSDSEVVTESSLLIGRQEAAYSMTSGLLKPGDKCNSLPEIENGNSKDELKHWLRKLDKLSLELQEFNSKMSTTTTQEAVMTTTTALPLDVPASIRTREPPEAPESYTSEEYRTWIFNRQASLRSPFRPKPPRRGRSMPGTSAVQTEALDAKPLKSSPDTAAIAKATSSSSSSPSSSSYYDPKQLMASSSSRVSKVIRPMEPRGEAATAAAAGAGRPRVGRTVEASAKEHGLTRKPLRIRPEEFRIHAASTSTEIPDVDPAIRFRPQQRRRTLAFDGLLYVHVYCGHGLKTTRTTLRDLYCVLSVDGLNKARTAIRTGAINFDWDEDFEVELDAARTVSFSVYNWDPVAKQRLCFASSLTLEDFIVEGGDRQRLALRLEPAGVMYLDLVYKDLSLRFQRRPSQEPRPVFGADLQGIAAREGADHDGVPLAVRRCVEEIERRGLESVGLYRLCGSAKRQGQLKVDLEADPEKVDLSPRSVPDISVLTGVLKDFFRELVEPLLTNDLHQMLLDAMSVQIAEDPGGNADLMFSIIDCLPRENLSTLRFLFGHLRRVIRKRDDNKMTQVALGNIFGPILLCPAYRLVKQSIDLQKQAEVVAYILDIWPDNT